MMKREPISRPLLTEALKDSDVRVLLMVLFQLTGDRRWLDDRYRPRRDVRIFADPNAGLSSGVAAEIRDAALELLTAPEAVPAVAHPNKELFLELMSVCLGEPVPEEYYDMMANEMGFAQDVVLPVRYADGRVPSAIIIGAGFSGIACAIRLVRAGVRVHILEKNPDVGGTWLENTYPDCGVDTPNHFYSYSFAPNADWDHYFALRDEILGYIRQTADRFDIRQFVTFGVTVERAAWNDTDQVWEVTCRSTAGTEAIYSAQFLMSAVGQLNRAFTPAIAGRELFHGPAFHSAHWRHDVDFAGKSVAVIGTGASAMQFVPQLATQCRQLTIFQRSPHWSRPIGEYRIDVPTGVKWLLRHVPGYAAWFRFTLAWRFGDGLHRSLFKDPFWPHPERSLNAANDRHRDELEKYIRQSLDFDEELIAKCLPSYPPYAKRMLVDNGWYKALLRDNVALVTQPIERLASDAIMTSDGVGYPADVVVFATGFRANDFLGHIEVQGREGHLLSQQWGSDDPRAYLGITVPNFPNFFLFYGPNTNLAFGGSAVFHAECQARYVVDLVGKTVAAGIGSVEVRASVHDSYNAAVDALHEKMVWTHPGVDSWYRNSAGRVFANSPWRLVDYWNMTSCASLDDYRTTAAVV